MRIRFLFVVACTAALAFSQGRRAAPQPTPTVTAVESRLIEVPVSVLNVRGVPVHGLSRNQFRVFEDGVEQTIQSFAQTDGPVSFGIVFDASRSMEPRLDQAREAVARLFEEALHGDEYSLVEFNDTARTLCDFTPDTGLVQSAISRISAKGWTALFDGVHLSARSMRKARNPRRALVVLSDGEDNFSRHQKSELRAYLREAGVVVYSIGLSAGPFSQPSRHLRILSRETGGWYYPVNRIANLKESVRSIGDAIRQQYTITYRPTNSAADGRYHKIKVAVDSAAPVTLSWRQGYYAPLAQ